MDNSISISDLLLQAKQIKKAFVAAPTKEAAAIPPMDPAMMQQPPMDPSMMQGDPNAAMMQQPPMPPMDPSMMQGDPNAMPMPPMPPEGEQQAGDPIADITNVIAQMADGLDKIETRQNAADQKMQDIVSEFSKIQGKIDLLLSILGKGNV